MSWEGPAIGSDFWPDADELAKRVEELAEAGVQAHSFVCDVTSPEQVHGAVENARKSLGNIDLAIANAGLGFPTPAKRFVLDDAERIMRTNFYGMLTLFDAVLPEMLARRSGTFVGVPPSLENGASGSSIYSASKAAMHAFLKLRVELQRSGVKDAVVNPGFIDTPMTEKTGSACRS